MVVLDFILSFAALLLWVGWRAARSREGRTTRSVTGGEVSPATHLRRSWIPLLLLGTVMLLHAGLLYLLGKGINWSPVLDLGVVALPFRVDYFDHLVVYALLSFVRLWVIYHFSLVLLHGLNRPGPDDGCWRVWLQDHFGRFARWPALILVLVSVLLITCGWLTAHRLFVHMNLLPAPANWHQVWQEGLVLGLAGICTWQYPITVLLAAWMVHDYIYLGETPLWTFIERSGNALLRPLAGWKCHVRGINLTPVVMLALVWLVSNFAWRGLSYLYARLPF